MALADELAAVFAEAWPARAVVPSGLGERLAELCAAAVVPGPAAAIDDRELVRAIAGYAPDTPGELAAYVARCHPGELRLALAATRGIPGAIAEIERAYAGVFDAPARRFADATHTADDLHQILREKLFVAEPGRRPRIADYRGQGRLESWLRVTAVRVCLDLRKRKDRMREETANDDALLALPEPGDLALEVVKAQYRSAVAAALRAAARALPPGDRHLLRQHLVGELSIDQLGAALGIHRATAARRIASAKETLAAQTRRLVAEQLGLAGRELDEVIGLVMSRLDVSIGNLLASMSR